jgi:hypothetical protein
MLGSGSDRGDRWLYSFRMSGFLEKNFISDSACHSKNFLANRHYRANLPVFSFLNLFFNAVTIEKSERLESQNHQKSQNHQEIRKDRNDRCANISTELCMLRKRRCGSNSHRLQWKSLHFADFFFDFPALPTHVEMLLCANILAPHKS